MNLPHHVEDVSRGCSRQIERCIQRLLAPLKGGLMRFWRYAMVAAFVSALMAATVGVASPGPRETSAKASASRSDRGPRGPRGPAGPRGPQGPAGATGRTGSAGPTG